jgi:DNA-binding NarL/FixJ family response regulator
VRTVHLRPAAEATLAPAALLADAASEERISKLLVEAGIAAVGFRSIEEMLASLPSSRPSALVLSRAEPTSPIASLIEPVIRSGKGIPIVITCASMPRWELRAALAAGVSAVVLDDALEDALGPCVRAAQAGQVCVPLADWRAIDPPALSAREKQVLGLVAAGCMNSQIAERLFLAESTVKSHLSSVFAKLGVHSRNEAVELLNDGELRFGHLRTTGAANTTAS